MKIVWENLDLKFINITCNFEIFFFKIIKVHFFDYPADELVKKWTCVVAAMACRGLRHIIASCFWLTWQVHCGREHGWSPRVMVLVMTMVVSTGGGCGCCSGSGSDAGAVVAVAGRDGRCGCGG